ncbi:DUF1707 domain-containing protein [Pseudonocardia oroxyli]|uniref:DUF1707 domain-containing protein n=1 Tax=Pseudonocardia oroxyli TaxID=366584 RepID=A0A1G7XE07_PSEOR|nr:DUF1707 domain-containing protein [Pseudonocardia oroxyli]SDG82462.1 protein of unknown function [Pseudonocardia oroxyli]
MPRQDSTTRIGEAERAAAQRALQDHLNAQRLLVNEYADRSAAAATATTAGEIAALFTDLPAPHPKLPSGPGGGSKRRLVIVAALVVVVLVGTIAFVAGRGAEPTPAPGPVTPTAQPAPTTTTRPTTSAAATPTGQALASGGQVRRATNGQSITLTPGYRVDLDDLTSPNWLASNGCCGDVYFDSGSRYVTFNDDYAVMSGPADYAACTQATAYATGSVERGGLTPGKQFCVRTTEDRFAVVTVEGTTEQAFQFSVTVWDPRFR